MTQTKSLVIEGSTNPVIKMKDGTRISAVLELLKNMLRKYTKGIADTMYENPNKICSEVI